jgi:transposase
LTVPPLQDRGVFPVHLDKVSIERGIPARYGAVRRFFKAERISFKKSLHASEQDRPDVERRRPRWRQYQAIVEPSRLVFIDETWPKTNMTRTHGWCAVGKRVVDKVPHGHWKTMTFLAALRADRIEAPCVFDGPINGERFRAYVEQALVPTLKPGDVVIIDNLGSHKGTAVRRALRRAGAKRFFPPPYSLDLNPIEQVFARLKTLPRKANERSQTATWQRIGQLLDRFQPGECSRYLKKLRIRCKMTGSGSGSSCAGGRCPALPSPRPEVRARLVLVHQ